MRVEDFSLAKRVPCVTLNCSERHCGFWSFRFWDNRRQTFKHLKILTFRTHNFQLNYFVSSRSPQPSRNIIIIPSIVISPPSEHLTSNSQLSSPRSLQLYQKRAWWASRHQTWRNSKTRWLFVALWAPTLGRPSCGRGRDRARPPACRNCCNSALWWGSMRGSTRATPRTRRASRRR